MRFNGAPQRGIHSTNRFEDRSRLRLRAALRLPLERKEARDRGAHLISGRDSAHDLEDHNATRYTPHATNAAPIHRRPSTRSFSNARASMVSRTKLAAEA